MEEVFKLGALGIQYVFVSEKAIKRLHFDRCVQAKKEYIGQYKKQVDEATTLFDKILFESVNNNDGTTIKDLIK